MIQLRNATPSDASFIAEMILTALHIDTENNASLLQHIEELVKNEDTLYAWKHCILANNNEEAAGLCLAYDAKDYHDRSIKTFRTKYFNGKNLIDYIPSLEHNVDEAGEGEYYIDSVAVSPQYRGHGIARIMMSKAIETAQTKGLLPTLLVDPENTNALRLYTSLGFEYHNLIHAFGLDYHKYAISQK